VNGASSVRTAFASILIFLASCQCASALNPSLDVSQYAHTVWKVRDGFLNGSVTAIAQTPDGYLWIGTEFGLFRFDGVRAVQWQPPVGRTGAAIRGYQLLVARDGTLWISSAPGVASLKDGRLIEYPTLADVRLYTRMLEDREGHIWLGSTFPPQARLCEIKNGGAHCVEDEKLGPIVSSLFEDSHGTLWAGTAAGVERWKPGRPRFFPLPEQQNGYQGLAEERGALLVSSPDGLKRFIDGKIEMAYPSPQRLRPFTAHALLRDRDGSLWMGTSGRGLAHIHQGRTDLFTQADGLSGDFVSGLFQDREGSIWVATTTGLDRFRDVAVPTVSVAQGLSNETITSVLATKDGSVWIGTYDGLKRWTHDQLTIYREQHRETRPGVREIVGKGLPDRGVHTMLQDTRGRVWISDRRGAGYLEQDHFVPVPGVP